MTTTVEHIWTEWSTRLKQFILKRVSEKSIADDVLQEVFFKIHSRIHTLKDISKLQGWIYQIARNTIIDHYRRQRTMAQLPEALWEPDDEDANGVIEAITPCIASMVEELPEKYRQAVMLTSYKGLTQKEMGEELGLSVSGAKSRAQRAREKLKSMLMDCCHFELDGMGNVIGYQKKPDFSSNRGSAIPT